MENLDFFKINFQFNFRNNQNFSTGLSQILSIILILIISIIFLMNFIKMTLKQGLIINSYITDLSADDKVIFNESNSFYDCHCHVPI